jgi:hypothetical protein
MDLAGLLNPLVGQSEYHIKYSEAFVQKLQSIKLEETDILVSFDVISLFTKVPLDDTIQLLSGHFNRLLISSNMFLQPRASSTTVLSTIRRTWSQWYCLWLPS